MPSNVFWKKGLVVGMVVFFFGISFTNASSSLPVSESNISTNYDNILKYVTARLSWNPGEVEVEVLNEGIGEGYGIAGPFGFFDYEFGWEINSSYLILNGTINVKPLTSQRLTLNPGDKLSMMAYFGSAITDPDGNGICVGKAFGITIEKP